MNIYQMSKKMRGTTLGWTKKNNKKRPFLAPRIPPYNYDIKLNIVPDFYLHGF